MKKLFYQLLFLDDRPDTLVYIMDMLSDLPFIATPVVLSNMEEALVYIRDNEVDVLLLDMDLGRQDLNGPRFMAMLAKPPVTIACSAHTDYVFEATEAGAFKYISKTIGFNALERIMRAAVEEADRKADLERRDIVTLELMDTMGREVVLQVAELCYAQVSNNVVTVYMDTEEYEFKMALSKLSNLLPAERFGRAHCSYLVALDRVVEVRQRKVYLRGTYSTHQIPVSQECSKEFKHALDLFRQGII